jgi:anaerobic ribonucleoside-triphosphate reductase
MQTRRRRQEVSDEAVTGKKGSCGLKTEVWARCTGYLRPTANWNKGKREEFKDRRPYAYQTNNA